MVMLMNNYLIISNFNIKMLNYLQYVHNRLIFFNSQVTEYNGKCYNFRYV